MATYALKSNNSTDQSMSLATGLKRWKFALALPILDPSILPYDERKCRTCRKPYNPDFNIAGPNVGHETSTVLPCGCVMGFHCARDRLSPFAGGFVSCPFCGHEFPEMFDEPKMDADASFNEEFAWLSVFDKDASLSQQDPKLDNCTGMTSTTSGKSASTSHVLPFPSIDEMLALGSPAPSMYEAVQRRPSMTMTKR